MTFSALHPKYCKLHTASAGWVVLVLSLASTFAVADDAAVDLSKLERIEIQPKRLQFNQSRDRAIVLVTGHFPNGLIVDLTRQAQFTSAAPAIATYQDGFVCPNGKGSCEIEIKAANQKALLSVVVEGVDKPAPISFRAETVAALTRQGCNSGACHGSPSGKGGFQLSLQAYDHALDEFSLTRAEKARRINSIEPATSLLLLKPTMTVPHRGGLQLRLDDYAYHVLRQWIAEGGCVDSAEDKRCVRLELLPRSGRTLTDPHWHQQMVAVAHFEEGTQRDVTRLTRFSSSDDQIASISSDGILQGHGRGQVAVMARYLDQLVSCQFTLVKGIEGFHWSAPPAANYIDELVYEKLRQLQYEPSDLCSDSEFVRRVYLDVVGALPTIAQQDAFLADQKPDRRQRLINDLLDRPEHARFWALKWGDLLRLQKNRLKETGVYKFYQWLVNVFETNRPFNQFAVELLTAQGSTYDHPAANYYRACDDPISAAETTAQLFLGSRIQCAKCHNHPFENWTQDNFYGLTAIFQRVKRKPGLRVDEEIVYLAREGEVHQPRTGQAMKPWLPGGGSFGDDKTVQDRRHFFVDWLTSPTNPFFARVAVNRIWAEVMGQGIVEPVDDFRQSNPPANSALLDELANDFVEHGYDQKHILRTILGSRTYQLSSQATKLNTDDTRLFSHAKARLLTAEQMLDAVCQVTQVSEVFPGLPVGTLAIELPSPDFEQGFLDKFGRPARATACECERGTASTLAQAIELFNGPMVQKKLVDKQNRVHRQLDQGLPHKELITQLYRAAVCRLPTDTELKTSIEHIATKKKPAEGFEDVCWALLNTEEFLTQH
jgi:hypothetical protein